MFDRYTKFLPVKKENLREYNKMGATLKERDGEHYIDAETVLNLVKNAFDEIGYEKDELVEKHNNIKAWLIKNYPKHKDLRKDFSKNTKAVKDLDENIHVLKKDLQDVEGKINKTNEILDNLNQLAIKVDKEIKESIKIKKEEIGEIKIESIQKQFVMQQQKELDSFKDIVRQKENEFVQQFDKEIETSKEDIIDHYSKCLNKDIRMIMHEFGFRAQDIFENKIEVKVNDPLGLTQLMIKGIKKQHPKDVKEERKSVGVLEAWRNKLKKIVPNELKKEKDEVIKSIDNFIDNSKQWGDKPEQSLIAALRDLQHVLEDFEDEQERKRLEKEKKELEQKQKMKDQESKSSEDIKNENDKDIEAQPVEKEEEDMGDEIDLDEDDEEKLEVEETKGSKGINFGI
ncbi:hypothetical protein CMI42_00385 [Candidatus Pacearchaeota archaeon]|nr:hypothetical protein [Candidatus Pacearchaeota archaeon]|tara:strand:- start:385 stop:1584 length:1200 start_codon:yes stop_codon:yes gene_type:complete